MNFMTKYYRNAKYKHRLPFLCICSSLRCFVFITSFFTAFWLLNSCEEPPTIIGSDILPGGDYISISSSDTFRITSYTNYVSEVRTETIKTPYIGVYSDPYFGTTTSGFVTQLRLSEKWDTAATNISLAVDSVQLFLRIISGYGSNDNSRHYLRISEISDMLYNNTAYYSNTLVDTTGFGVSAVIPPLRSDTINHIAINLPNSFGEYMVRDTSKLFYTTDTTETDFRNYFKGIYITIPTASATDPFLLGFDFTYAADYGYRNYIAVYMHDKEAPDISYNYYFVLDSRRENARFTKIEHDFSANIKNVIDHQVVDSLSYVQGLYGAYTTISIPGLETIKNDPARIRSAINKARLIAPMHLAYTDSTVAQSLLMRYVNADGEKEIVPDYFVDDYNEYFSGVFNTEKHVYNFNLSSFVQNYFNDKENKLKPELEIFLPANSAVSTILKANDSKTPLKFELTLTDY